MKANRIRIKALRAMMVCGQPVAAGDTVETTEADARFLIARGWAEEAPAKKPAARKSKKG